MRANRKVLSLALVGCLAAAGFMQQKFIYPFWKANYMPQTAGGEQAQGLSGDQLLATLTGFREITAGILWVRADEFFDQGNYDAILPIIRLVTWLDPHEIDVYATGMWHIGYNFTDEDSRSDRRYVPSAIALGKEGARNNSYTYELFFETGWLWYHKVDDDYDQAVKWWEDAATHKDIQPARRNILAMALMRDGKIESALDRYQKLLDDADKTLKEDPTNFQNNQNRDTIESNFDNLLVRMSQRGYFAQKGGYYDQGEYDTKPPYDVKFSAQVTVVEAGVLKVEGTWGVLPVGNRIRFIVRDADFPTAGPARIDWDGGKDVEFEPLHNFTYLQDSLFVKNQQFAKRVDMSRDPTIYPMTTDKYVIEFYYNPRSSPAHMQDRFGFSGEGMTDANYLRDDVRPGQRVIYAKIEVSKDQLLRRGQWTNEVPIFRTKGFDPKGITKTDDVIVVPGMRANAPTGTTGGGVPGGKLIPKKNPVTE